MKIFNCLQFRHFGLIAAVLVFCSNPALVRADIVQCSNIFSAKQLAYGDLASHSSFDKVVSVMEQGQYPADQLPIIPLRMFKWIGKRLSFFVAQRSHEILVDRRDYRIQGIEKPIHPMGVGLIGRIRMMPSRWSGLFSGGEFPVVARASISQGNPLKYLPDGRMQVRSTAMAVKVFASQDKGADVPTANAVFQNNLNGLLGSDNKPLNFLESAQSNQPGLKFSKIRKLYEVQTLLGVALGAIQNPKDHTSRVPFINPQIRPVHSWAEMGVQRIEEVRTPVWVEIRPKVQGVVLDRNDFRIEIVDTLKRDRVLEYEIFAADAQDSRGKIQWEHVGIIYFDRSILSKGVDQNLLFPHDSLNSSWTGKKFEIPEPHKQYDSVPDDIQ